MEEPKKEEELKLKELELQKRELELRNKELELELSKSATKGRFRSREINVPWVFLPITIVIVAVIITAVLLGGHSTATLPVPAPSNTSIPTASSSGIINFTSLPGPLLSQINNYPASDLISVAKGMLNGSVNIPIDSNTQQGIFSLAASGVQVPAVKTDGKIDFYFAGQSACQFCGRDRWAIDLALSQFGSFSSLYTGYTYGDANYPTLFWSNKVQDFSSLPYPYQNYTIGSSYSSRSINFVTADLYPAEGSGFYGPAVDYFESVDPAISPLFSNSTKFDNAAVSNGGFGTPLELFGSYLVNGAFTDVPVPYEPFSTIISSFYSLNSEFAVATVAGADMYVADLCHVNESAGTICSDYNWSTFYSKFG